MIIFAFFHIAFVEKVPLVLETNTKILEIDLILDIGFWILDFVFINTSPRSSQVKNERDIEIYNNVASLSR